MSILLLAFFQAVVFHGDVRPHGGVEVSVAADIYEIWRQSDMGQKQSAEATPDPYDNGSLPATVNGVRFPYADRLDELN